MTYTQKFLWAGIAVASLTVPLPLPDLLAQTGAPASPPQSRPAFEVATIKLAAPDAVRNRVLQLQGRVEIETRRERTLEGLVAYRAEAPPPDAEG